MVDPPARLDFWSELPGPEQSISWLRLPLAIRKLESGLVLDTGATIAFPTVDNFATKVREKPGRKSRPVASATTTDDVQQRFRW